MGDLAGGEVDREVERTRVRALLVPGQGLLAGALEHPAADRLDQAALLGDRDELAGPSRPRSGCCQRSSASTAVDLAGCEGDDRLVVEQQLVARRAPGAAPARAPGAGPRGRASPRRRARSGLGRAPWPGTSPRRRRGSGRSALHLPVAGVGDRDADAGGDEVLGPVEVETAARRRSQTRSAIARASCSSVRSSTRIPNSSPPKRATVSRGTQVVAQPRRHRPQQLVAGVVAEAVVDHLEVVEVEEEDPDRIARARPPGAAPPRGCRRNGGGWAAR